VLEAFVLSTCNRTEIYARTLDTQDFYPFSIKQLCSIKKITFDHKLAAHFYVYRDREAVRHFLRVTTGLDSLVLGEKQILGQVKDSLKRARERGMFTRDFNILANIAVRAGKMAQHDSLISYGGSSVGWAAIALAENILGTLQDKTVLLIGAGKMGEISLTQLKHKSPRKIYLMNRTQCIAEELAARHQADSASFADIKEILAEADVTVCASGAPHYVLDAVTVEKVLPARNGRRLILIDISMPRNIDPACAAFKDVYLADIDDLQQVVDATMQKRQAAVGQVESIIEDKLAAYYDRLSRVSDFDGETQISAA